VVEKLNLSIHLSDVHIKLISVVSFLARDVIYTSRAYATMSVPICLSVCV